MTTTDTRTQHTPGPWTISDDGYSIGNGHDPDVAFVNALPVAMTLRHPDKLAHLGNHEWEANARLIAAAPDLLAITEIAMNNHSIDRHGGSDDYVCPFCAECRAAIAKAKGGAR